MEGKQEEGVPIFKVVSSSTVFFMGMCEGDVDTIRQEILGPLGINGRNPVIFPLNDHEDSTTVGGSHW